MDFCLEIFKTFKFLTLNKLLNIWNQISLHILPLSLLCCFMVVFFFPLVFYYLSSTSDTQRVNINLAQEGRCRSYSSTGNWVSLNRFQHLYLKGNIWFFPPPREVKASSQRINSKFSSHLWRLNGRTFLSLHAPEWSDEEGLSGLGTEQIPVSTGNFNSIFHRSDFISASLQ